MTASSPADREPGSTAGPRPLLVVTYGRSGSTLLQGLLNTLPGVSLRGENMFALLPMYRAHHRLRVVQRRFGEAAATKGPRSAFYGGDRYDLDAFARDLGAALTRQLSLADDRPVQHLGHKEIRWYEVPVDQRAEFLDFLDAAFPGVRFILHRRAHDEVRTSSFWRELSDEKVAGRLERVEQLQDEIAERWPQRTLRTDYAAFTTTGTQDEALRALATFMVGGCDAETLGRLRSVLTIGHGPVPFTGSGAPSQPA